jgi:biotin carboxylase
MAPRLMLVLPTRTYRAAAFLRAAERLGLEVVVASEEAPTLAPLMAGRVLTLDLGSPEQAAERAAQFGSERRVDAVVGVDESAVLTAAHVAARLALRNNPVAAVAATRDKRRLRAALAAAGVPQPRHVEIHADPEGSDAAMAAAAVGLPCVVKPVGLAASRGVIRADSVAELAAAIGRVDSLLRSPGVCDEGSTPAVLVESFVQGPECAVEGLLDGGELTVLAVWDKPDPLDGPFFEETMFVTPSLLDGETRAAIAGCTRQAVAALGLRAGPIHAELRLPDGRPVLIEVAARSIGGQCSSALRFENDSDGADLTLEDLVLRQAIGRPVVRPRLVTGAAGVLMLPIRRSGVLRRVDGVEAARSVAGITGVTVSIPVGEKVVALPEGDRYLGFVFARANQPREVVAALRRAQELIAVDIVAEAVTAEAWP